MNEKLRLQVKQLKMLQGINYNEISQYLEIKQNSFYNWLKGYYNFGEERQRALQEIIDTLREE